MEITNRNLGCPHETAAGERLRHCRVSLAVTTLVVAAESGILLAARQLRSTGAINHVQYVASLTFLGVVLPVVLVFLLLINRLRGSRAVHAVDCGEAVIVNTEYDAALRDLAILNERMEHAAHRFQELYQALPVPCYCYDEHGRVFEWNRALELFFSLSPDQLFQRYACDLLASPDERQILREKITAVFAGDVPHEWEQKWHLPDGSTKYLLCGAFPLRNKEGVITGGINTSVDITDRKLAEQAVVRAEEKYRSIFENAVEGIFQSTPSGRLLNVNPSMVHIFGHQSVSQMLEDVRDISSHCYANPDDRMRFQKILAMQSRVSKFEVQMLKADGERIWVSLSAGAAYGSDGQISHYEGSLVDITEQRLASERLRMSEERLREFHLITSLPDLPFWDKTQGLLALICTQFGFTSCWAAETNGNFKCVHASWPNGCDCESGVHEQMAIHSSDGQWGVLGFTRAHLSKPLVESELDFLHLAAQWIGGEVERESSRHGLMESETRFRSAIASMQEGFIVEDSNGKVILSNKAAETILGLGAEDLRQADARADWQLIREDGEVFPSSERPSAVTFSTGETQAEVVAGVVRPGNPEPIWLLLNSSPLYSAASDSPSAVVLTFTDISQRRHQEAQIADSLEQIRSYAVLLESQKKELEQQKQILLRSNLDLETANSALEALATSDGLTGLKNHRTLQERLAQEVERADRYGRPLSLIMIDVDHFKQFNDSFGHPAGDEVLKTVARLMETTARESDLTARYGGEEFVMLLPDTDMEGALQLAERVREAVSDHPWTERSVTCSLGVSTLSLAITDGASLIESADFALYRAKVSGRNVAIHSAALQAVS